MEWSMRFFLVFLVTTLARYSCNAIKCYKCDSVILPSCAMGINETVLPQEECKSAFACAMSIVDTITYRGCSTDTPMQGSTYYKTCTQNLCNMGVYPPGRLKCHQCSGTACVAAPMTKAIPCLYHHEVDACYTFVIDESNTHRGCRSDTNSSRHDLVQFCDFNGCNNQAGFTTLTCSQCDSRHGRGCKIDLFGVNRPQCNITLEKTCRVKVFLGLPETCYLYHKLDHVVRGCTRNIDATLAGDADHLLKCNSHNKCNAVCLKQQKCVICDSETDERCIEKSSEIMVRGCSSAEASSCHAVEHVDGRVQRDCGRPPFGGSIRRFYECDNGEGCNSATFTNCYKCGDTDDNPNCAQWANEANIETEECNIMGARCIIGVLPNGKIVRGCSSGELSCNGSVAFTKCFACEGNLCNGGVYPPSRLRCYHCDGGEQCNEVAAGKAVLPCPYFTGENQLEACFEFLNTNGNMVRGCSSDKLAYKECLLSESRCHVCTENGCNRSPALRAPSLACYQCQRTNSNCMWVQESNATLKICTAKVPFGSEESCFSLRYKDGGTSRGCSLDDANSLDINNFSLWQTCNTTACNAAATAFQNCIKCQSNFTGSGFCENRADQLPAMLCGNTSTTVDKHGCYTIIQGGILERGCACDLNSAELDECKNGSNKGCHYCEGQECNTLSIKELSFNRGTISGFSWNTWLTSIVFFYIFVRLRYAI